MLWLVTFYDAKQYSIRTIIESCNYWFTPMWLPCNAMYKLWFVWIWYWIVKDMDVFRYWYIVLYRMLIILAINCMVFVTTCYQHWIANIKVVSHILRFVNYLLFLWIIGAAVAGAGKHNSPIKCPIYGQS